MLWIVLALIVIALLGAPLFAVIGAIALAGFHLAGYDLSVVVIEYYRLGENPVLIAIPLFTLAGYLLSESEAPRRLVRLSDALLGWLPGGLAIVALVVSALFTALTGASGVTIVALGALLYPALVQAGYPRMFSLGLVTTSGSLGLLFAPSLPLILYGFVAQQLDTQPPVDIGELFIAGILPGLLMIVLLALYCMRVGMQVPRAERRGRGELWAALRDAGWEIPLPFVVLGGIYSGWLAPSEVAAVTVLYVFAVVVLIRRELPWGKLAATGREAMRMVGAILIILGLALGLTNWMIDAEVPQGLFALLQANVQSGWLFLLLVNVFLLLVGMLLDVFSAVFVLVPMLLPVAQGYGIDPVHFGILMLANLQIGYFTPPIGMNLFIASLRFKVPLLELARACLPFFGILLIALVLITWWPALSLVWVR
ncbi:MAG TPA: TRAP transporter large permease subunit [Xanthomonadaceae bacterium]|nr:TRAP transporter large permease subunit [Xanthomonadaceae bacterium]